ncbi:acetylxylan esterase [Mycetocola zhadangensis]|uniref:Acetylesterase n=1 Tax=Mycetocola zhadangensis TaxID=1164595 RepID=A0A3L7IXA2_9MICO|nr:acetylxylan esterase [Mycetocola zhadangensis]RLQ82785.1 acetylesterase [Mycetocola zhadangensis]GGE98154.1 acetylxylan esterase [Mycetocola zhadangensis]
MYVDMPESELTDYRSSQIDPVDFDEFWDATLTAARAAASAVRIEPIDSGLTTIDIFDVTFSGWDGQSVKAWLRVPKGTTGPLPTIVQFVGYGGGRGHFLENLLFASSGFAHFQMDTRGQGSSWSLGDTPDPDGTGPQYPGVMTRGIDSRETYYYRRLFTDAVRAIDTVRELPRVDTSRISVFGISQGGGIALAVAGLVPGLAAVAPCVPFLCDFPRAITMTDAYPYKEVRDYLAVHRHKVGAVAEVLPYFDGVNFARRATAPALFSASMMDATCPPSTVHGAYNVYGGERSMSLWQFNGHEGGGIVDEMRALEFFRSTARVD